MLARPAAASALAGAALGAANSRRLGLAALAVVAAHVVLLFVRPAPAGHTAPATASSVMAVRMVQTSALQRASLAASPTSSTEPAPSLPATPPQAVAEAPRAASAAAPTPTRQGPAHDSVRAGAPGIPSDARAPEGSLAAAPDYALGVRLDPGPRPLEDIEPDYPDMAALREGVVVLRLLISETGHVDDVGVVRAEPRGIFEEAAIEAFSKARFSPGLAAGRPVKSQITVEVQFMPVNRGGRVSGRTY